MIFKNSLVPAVLLKRYKRFLADVLLDSGETITVYCPNTGSMRTCSDPGSRVCLSRAENPTRKYPFTLEMIEVGNTWVGVNTGRTNAIVAEAIQRQEIQEIQGEITIKREVKVSQDSRLDLLIECDERHVYIEVKNCSMVENGVAMFPDAVTARGTKHLLELAELIGKGAEAVIFFLVQRVDAHLFKPAADIDLRYAAILREVYEKGVEILVYQAQVSPEGINVVRPLPFTLI